MNYSEAGKLGAKASKATINAKHDLFVARYNDEPKLCKLCKMPLPFKKRMNDYCSHSCAATKNNKERNSGPRLCLSCDLPTDNKYCSSKCCKRHRHDTFINEWLKGNRNAVTCGGMSVSVHVKRWLRTERGDQCELCGWNSVNKVTGRIPLQLDHKNGNAEDNRPENLQLLCPNCHSLTPTFGSLNRGNGRKLRYKK